MRILVLHNAYQLAGGEDSAVREEVALLRSAGHDVHCEIVSNDEITGIRDKVKAFISAPHAAWRGPWVSGLIDRTRAEVVHVHNFFPLLTPAVHLAAARRGVAVVQTLHNFRLLCANALLFREGKICEKCLTGGRGWGIVHQCYRGSLAGSVASVLMQQRAHSQTWLDCIHQFIALTEFSRHKFVQGGLPEHRISVKPNFVTDTPSASVDHREGMLYVGRLSAEKGVHTLVEAWKQLPSVPLTVIGEGPEASALRSNASPNVRFTGPLDKQAVRDAMENAQGLVVPSLCYEGFPMAVAEAFAASLPVIASNAGSLAEIVTSGVNGAHFHPGNPTDLARVVRGLIAEPSLLSALGSAAKSTFDACYSPTANLAALEEIYRTALKQSQLSRL